ncbi:MAG TPA: NHL repeat-containing protein [Polyangiales bacterium]|nr:NHL repeat-containing protein [Polyangiales bacterium]
MIQRRYFLRLSAAGAACLLWRDEALELAAGGRGIRALRVQPQRARSRTVFDRLGSAYEIEPLAGQVVERGPLGLPLRVIGSPGSGPEQLDHPIALAFGPDDELLVLDHGNSRVQVYSRAGKHLRQLGCLGGGPDELRKPRDHTLDREGRLWVADTLNNRIQVLDLLGKGRARFGTPGDGLGQLNGPCALAFAPDGLLHVLDAGNRRVQVFSQSGVAQGSYGEGLLEDPSSLAIAADGMAYLSDEQRGTLEVFGRDGSHKRQLRPCFAEGSAAIPQQLCFTPDGELHVDARREGRRAGAST